MIGNFLLITKQIDNMETTVIILSGINEVNYIPTLKTEIISYLGQRLISSEMKDSFCIGIYGTLDDEDKKAISLMVEKTNSPTLSILFIEHNKSFLNQTITTIQYNE